MKAWISLRRELWDSFEMKKEETLAVFSSHRRCSWFLFLWYYQMHILIYPKEYGYSKDQVKPIQGQLI